MPEFDQSLYWKLVPYFRVPMETVHVIRPVVGKCDKHNVVKYKKQNGLAFQAVTGSLALCPAISWYCGHELRGDAAARGR